MAERLAWHHEWHDAIRKAALDAVDEATDHARLNGLQDCPVTVSVTIKAAVNNG